MRHSLHPAPLHPAAARLTALADFKQLFAFGDESRGVGEGLGQNTSLMKLN
jgi:hypothetical protein